MADVMIITNPMIAANESAKVTLSKFLRVLEVCGGTIGVIGGNLRVDEDIEKVQLLSVPIKRSPNRTKRILNLFQLQFQTAALAFRHINKNMPVYFWIGDKMLLPYFAAKLKSAEIHYYIYGNPEKEGKAGKLSRISADLIRFMANHADYICMESPSVKQEWSGLKAKNEQIIHLYTDLAPMTVIEKRGKTIGMLCRLTAGKHVLESIQAFSVFHERHPEWKLEIIGSGVQEAECRNLIRELHLDNVVVLHGWVDHTHMRDLTEKWSYLLFPSDTEGVPNGVIEMMAQGIPAIASPVGGISDLIEPNKTGWFIDDCSVRGVLEALERAVVADSYGEVAVGARSVIAQKYVLEAAQADAKSQMSR